MYYLGNFAIHILLGLLCCSTVTVEGRTRLLLTGSNSNEAEAREFLRSYNEDAARLLNNATRMEWAYNTNISDANAAAANEASLRYSAFSSKAFEDASNFLTTNFSSDTVRQLASVGRKALSDEEMETLTKIISDMGGIYGKGQACLDHSNLSSCYNLEPELTEILASTETAEDVRKTLWEDWHNSVGKDLKPYYIQYVGLKNRLARVNNYSDYGEEWRDRYEDLKYDETVKVLYDQMLPLYKKLHAYVRHKLAKHYQIEIPQYLPQHLLGDMWGRFWSNLYKIAVPYPAEPSLDVTENMRKQNYTVRKMYETSDEFYKSMGLIPLPSTFFNVSMLERPEGRDVICHATAWDFYDGKDFRIKMCTNINMDDFLTVHHEMGHIQYFMQYAGQPTVYRDGANDGFHEAVGELMSMCVSTPKHLYAIGLLDDLYDNKETTVNYLFSRALATLSTLPFHYLQDLWRWRIFRGEISVEKWNEEFWKMSRDIAGVTSPVSRPDDVLDGPTIFHVAQDYDMIRYFTRTILQFQFAETLCREAGHVGDLYNCDFYGSLAAGDKLASMLKLGRSKPWKEALQAMTGTQEMSAVPITTYFKPLEEFLDKYIADENLQVGWDNSPPEVGQLAF